MNARRAALPVLLLIAVLAQCVFAVRLIAGAVYASRGDAALSGRDFAVAAAAYARATRLVPYRGDWDYAYAGAQRSVSGDAAALPVYERALSNAPYLEAAMVPAAESLSREGGIAEATAMLDRASAITPYDWQIHHMRGVIATLEGRAADAVSALRLAAALSPELNPTIQNPLANALYSIGAFAEAVHEAGLAIAAQPLVPVHHLIRGKAWFAMSNYVDARKEFEWCARAFRRRLDRGEDVAAPLAESEQLLALALIGEGRPQEAVAPLERLAGDSALSAAAAAERIVPWLARAGGEAPPGLWASVAGVLVDARRLKDAHDVLSQAETAFPGNNDGALIGLRARALSMEGRSEDALEMLNVAPDAARTEPEFMLALALAHAQGGQAASAALEYRALIDRADVPPRIRRRAAEGLAALPNQ